MQNKDTKTIIIVSLILGLSIFAIILAVTFIYINQVAYEPAHIETMKSEPQLFESHKPVIADQWCVDNPGKCKG